MSNRKSLWSKVGKEQCLDTNAKRITLLQKQYLSGVCGGRSKLESSDIYWCHNCKVPLYEKGVQNAAIRRRENNYGYPPGFPTGEAFAGINME